MFTPASYSLLLTTITSGHLLFERLPTSCGSFHALFVCLFAPFDTFISSKDMQDTIKTNKHTKSQFFNDRWIHIYFISCEHNLFLEQYKILRYILSDICIAMFTQKHFYGFLILNFFLLGLNGGLAVNTRSM